MFKEIQVPKDAILIAKNEDLYYADCFTVKIISNLSCLDIYYLMTSNLPNGVKLLFKTRDILVRPFGIKTVIGFGKDTGKTTLNKGEKLDFFTVEYYEKSLMILKIKDIHLDVMAVLKLSSNDKSTKTLSLTTSVKTHNQIGKYYMKLIIPWHKYIVRLMFRKLTKF